MRKRLIFSTAVLACAGVVAMLADGTTVGAVGGCPSGIGAQNALGHPTSIRFSSGTRF